MPKNIPGEYRPPRHRATSDPLAAALLPPPDESAIDRDERLKRETEAKKVSDSIDDMIRQERSDRKKNRPEVTVLLLGQSESGKSTTLKQFQLLHSPTAFSLERIAWRAVIYLNLLRSIRRILDALAPDNDPMDDNDDEDYSPETASVIISASGRPPSAILGTRVSKYDHYRRRLEPLADLEEKLFQMLSTSDEDEATQLGPSRPHWEHYANFYKNENVPPSGALSASRPTIVIPQNSEHNSRGLPIAYRSSTGNIPPPPVKTKEIVIHTSRNWKKPFALGKAKSPKSPHTGEIEGWWEDPEDPVHVLNACAPTMLEMWRDPQVRKVLQEKRLRLEETSGFYLEEIPRITAKKYIPTDADVLKARLKTMGVVEHTFCIPSGSNRGVEWCIYDVGGARNQRAAWAPYFEDVNAIIFLAPISVFDQVLAEDPRVNRLEDSLHLWHTVVSNKLLANVSIVLFLNKCDLLQAKLQAGVKLSHYMLNYADRPNDYRSIVKYFTHKFTVIHETYTPNKERDLLIHVTAVTDTSKTAKIISSVRDIIIKGNLRNMRLV
ncbi:hypothetical protein D9619_002690 [Psilocybe cf. subviscida]|uniref:G-alpha-domain-containing protein n=1 Tax=Psilocybe cf. subviscida TaxID=2480587 RepID=A0A8H5AXI0_9AGAR|nr:hypothetical protein D9619_002690 [Psilocybe cf. subviscida]